MANKIRALVITNRITERTPNLDRYFSEINKIPTITAKEELVIAARAKKGDINAREQLINSNLKFVVSVAKQYTNQYVQLSDLICEGNIGLVEAVETFDPTTGFKFISYAVWHIRKKIYQHLNTHGRSIRIPLNAIRDLNRAKNVEARLAQQNEREISVEEILEVLDELNMSVKKHSLLRSMQLNKRAISLDPLDGGSDENVASPINVIPSEINSPLERVEENDRSLIFEKVFSALTPLEQKILTLRLGLLDGIPIPFKNIAEPYERTTEWARRVYMRALKKAKKQALKIGWKSVEWEKRRNKEDGIGWLTY